MRMYSYVSLQIEWARANDDQVKIIAENGRKYAQENLMPRDVYCYHAALFKVRQNRLPPDPLYNNYSCCTFTQVGFQQLHCK